MYITENAYVLKEGMTLEVTDVSGSYDLDNGSHYLLQNTGDDVVYINNVNNVDATTDDFELKPGTIINPIKGDIINYVSDTTSNLKLVKIQIKEV